MPLIKSGSKKAFSENVSEMMHHGHPQKQALAAAYSMMRKAGHKMSKGGMCEACGGSCKYAEGGPVPPPPPPDEVTQSMRKAFHFDEGGKVKRHIDDDLSDSEKQKARSERHPVSISGGSSHSDKRVGQPHRNERGTSLSWSQGESLGRHEDKVFKSGTSARKEEAKDNLNDLKQQNPKLKGLAHGGRVTLHNGAIRSFMDKGEFDVGSNAEPSPKMRGITSMEYAKGGEVEHEMEEMGEMDHELHEMAADELFDAFKKGDKKEFLESLKALIMSMKD